jgi:epoxyqueuosine reductase
LLAWLDAGFHGSMGYMAAHGLKRARPAELLTGTVSVISARMDYLPMNGHATWLRDEEAAAADPQHALVSMYARGRDYHKVLRARLADLAGRLQAEVGTLGHRAFTDSAPVLEVELATRAGLGWRGKHTLLLSREGGSMFFLGEIFLDLDLSGIDPASEPVSEPVSTPVSKPVSTAVSAHCGECTACITACPTGAIVAPYRLDARRCISYLTIEHAGPIPEQWRSAIGNRIYGCDDCQRACPWNKYAQRSELPDFDVRGALGQATLLQLWAWREDDFLRHTEGSAIRRIGFERWQRNLAVALGNAWRATGDAALAQALAAAREAATALVRDHIDWALAQRSRSAY